MLHHHASAPTGHFGQRVQHVHHPGVMAHHGHGHMPMAHGGHHHVGHHHGVHHGHHQPYHHHQNHGSLQLAPHRPTQAQTQPLLTPKVGVVDASNSSAVVPVCPGSRRSAPQLQGSTNGASTAREQELEQKLAELEALVSRKDQEIKELHSMLAKAGLKPPSPSDKKARQRDRVAAGGFRKVAESEPAVPYEAVDQDDPIDMRLQEFYNSTGSAVSFRRINRGFYRFGETIVELSIINHKLMARTEDGWNRSKFGPVEKFLMYYENIEREKAGVAPEP
eukprot:TRINITY_DN18099_c0_g1_i1.p1 TRINITY_DN18099_c0_g1~~TRINITY_DN18099_c0_g1_i1.p1  ORF type:complete len:278 (-),score=51.73 TRINITY_DN18099_c0_g1_i1:61-894(-)